jgi:hypothetical protein
MSDYILNINTDYRDAYGKQLVWDDRITSLYYYDASTEDSWERSYESIYEVFQNRDCDTVVSGTSGNWSDSSSCTASGNYTVATNYAVLNRTGDFVRYLNPTITAEGGYSVYPAANLKLWPLYNTDSSKYTTQPWTTNSGWGQAVFDFGTPITVDTVSVNWLGKLRDSGHDRRQYPRGFRVQTAMTGTTDYVTVVSGETWAYQNLPAYYDIPEVTARYFRLLLDYNWGDASYTCMNEFGLYKKPLNGAIMMWKDEFGGSSALNYAEVSQSVDLTGISKIYINLGGCISEVSSGPYGTVGVYINSTKVYNRKDDEVMTYLGTYGQNTFFTKLVAVDTSAYSGMNTVRIRFITRSWTAYGGRQDSYVWISDASVFPSWNLRYEDTEYTGPTNVFPEKTIIVGDSSGISIVDVSDVDTATGMLNAPKLWKRFVVHTSNFLQAPPTGVYAKEGKVYVSTYMGLYIIDFPNDCVDKYTTAGHYQIGGLAHCNQYTDGYRTANSQYLTYPTWATLSVATSVKLPSNVLTCIHSPEENDVSYIVGGTLGAGAFALVSGTVYSSYFKDTINKISSSNGVLSFCAGDGSDSRVGLMYDIGKVGYTSFNYDAVLHQGYEKISESFNSGYNPSLFSIKNGRQLSVTTGGTFAVVSGTVQTMDNDAQHCTILSTHGYSDRPFKASAYVKIKQWPDTCPGEFRFGVFNGDTSPGIQRYMSTARGVYLSARNNHGSPGILLSDDFQDGIQNYYGPNGGEYLLTNNGNFGEQYGHGLGTALFYTPVGAATSGGTAGINNQDCIINFEVQLFNLFADSGNWAECLIGLTNGRQYPVSGQQQLSIHFYHSAVYPTGLVRSLYISAGGATTFGAVSTTFAGTYNQNETSSWVKVSMWYTAATKTMQIYYNGIALSPVSGVSAWTAGGPYFYMYAGMSGYVLVNRCVFVRNMTVDYYNMRISGETRKYALCKKTVSARTTATEWPTYDEYPWRHASSAYEQLCTTSFSGTEGTNIESWRKWEIYYDPQHTCLSAYIDDVFLGSSNLPFTDVGPEAISIGFDTQFYPPTTASGNKYLEVHIKDVEITFSGTSFNNIPSHSPIFAPLMSGTCNDVGLVAQGPLVGNDISLAVASDGGVSKISMVKPTKYRLYDFSSGSLPAGWAAWDINGATGTSTWTSISGVLKQTGSIYGQGGITDVNKRFYSPFGTHMKTGINCNRTTESQEIVGKAINCRIRTTSSGFVGVGFNETYSVVGTITSGSGYYAGWSGSAFKVGKFGSFYNSVGSVYSYVDTEDFSLDYRNDVSDIGLFKNIGIYFSSSTNIFIYVDGVPVYDFVGSEPHYKYGAFTVICNNNIALEIEDVAIYTTAIVDGVDEYKTYSISTGTGQNKVIYGEEPKVSSLVTDMLFDRTSGLIEAGTTSGLYKLIRLEPIKVVDPGSQYFHRFVYDPIKERLICAAVTGGFGGGVGCVNVLEYSTKTNRWLFAGDVAALNQTSNYDCGYTTAWNPSVYRTHSVGTGTDAYCGIVFFEAPLYNKIYGIRSRSRVGVFDTLTSSVHRWGSLAIPAANSGARLNTKSIADRSDGFSSWLGCGGSTVPFYGVPTFSWYDGLIYATRHIDGDAYWEFGFGYLGQVFWVIFPGKVGDPWSWASNGALSLDGNVIHNPPIGTSSATDASLYDCYHQSYVYVSFNDSIYSLRYSKLYRLDLRTNRWVLMSDPPFTMQTGTPSGTDYVVNTVMMVYVQHLEKIFTPNYTDGYIYVYDVKTDAWVDRRFVPGGTQQQACLYYCEPRNSIYINNGIDTEVYEMFLPTPKYLLEYNPSTESDVLPENSSVGKFSWNGPDSFVPTTTTLTTSGIDYGYWFLTGSGTTSQYFPNPWTATGGYVGASSEGNSLRVNCALQASLIRTGVGGVSTRVPIRGNSFTATMLARPTQVYNCTGSNAVYSIFGVGEGAVNVGGRGGKTSAPARLHHRGTSGVYMAAYSHSSYLNRYTLVKRDGSVTTNLAASSYVSFYAGDGTRNAQYRDWTIQYDAPTRILTATISGTTIGSYTLNSPLPEMFIEFGVFAPIYSGGSPYPEQTLEAKSITVDFNNGATLRAMDIINHTLTINKNVAYNTGYFYDRTYPILSSEKSFIYETTVNVTTHTNTNTPYILSIGRIQDGTHEINLCAVNDAGTRKIGFWNGGSPWSSGGFSALENFEWDVENTYTMVRESGIVKVYTNGDTTPVTTIQCSLLPSVPIYKRNVAFGVIDIDKDMCEIVDASIDDGGLATLYGTGWTRANHASGNPVASISWYGSQISNTVSAGDYANYVEWRFTTASGVTGYLYYAPSSCTTDNAIDSPYTIYHSGVVDSPIPDGYLTNNIAKIYSNTSHSGTAYTNATTLEVNDRKNCRGSDGFGFFGGQTYLGAYSDISRVVATRDAVSGTYVRPGTMFLYRADRSERLKTTSTSVWSYVKLYVGDTSFDSSGKVSAFSILDTSTESLVDYYSTTTDPSANIEDVTSVVLA